MFHGNAIELRLCYSGASTIVKTSRDKNALGAQLFLLIIPMTKFCLCLGASTMHAHVSKQLSFASLSVSLLGPHHCSVLTAAMCVWGSFFCLCLSSAARNSIIKRHLQHDSRQLARQRCACQPWRWCYTRRHQESALLSEDNSYV